MEAVDIELRSVDGCPNAELADQRLSVALQAIGVQASIRSRLVHNAEEAEALGFSGSPTILIDGRDPFGRSGGSGALSCRLYRTGEGVLGCPTIEQLISALQAAAD
jgi:hypothetical protein